MQAFQNHGSFPHIIIAYKGNLDFDKHEKHNLYNEPQTILLVFFAIDSYNVCLVNRSISLVKRHLPVLIWKKKSFSMISMQSYCRGNLQLPVTMHISRNDKDNRNHILQSHWEPLCDALWDDIKIISGSLNYLVAFILWNDSCSNNFLSLFCLKQHNFLVFL